MSDSDNKRLPSEEEPQEEYVDDSISQDQKEEVDESKYETWSIDKLREEAKKIELPNYDKLSKKQLIERLKKY